MDTDSSSDEELELMACVVAAIAARKRKRKHRIWVREMYQTREFWKTRGIKSAGTLYPRFFAAVGAPVFALRSPGEKVY